MSAVVFACGAAHHLMEVDFVRTSPQVHLHFLTNDSEYNELGYAKVEFCCHGCGESLLMYYTDDTLKTQHTKLKKKFVDRHLNCRNYGYEQSCPNWRTSFTRVDMRRAQKAPTPRKKAESPTKLSSER